jgi:hypothetical protein
MRDELPVATLLQNGTVTLLLEEQLMLGDCTSQKNYDDEVVTLLVEMKLVAIQQRIWISASMYLLQVAEKNMGSAKISHLVSWAMLKTMQISRHRYFH